jgi:hypothetical protein
VRALAIETVDEGVELILLLIIALDLDDQALDLERELVGVPIGPARTVSGPPRGRFLCID